MEEAPNYLTAIIEIVVLLVLSAYFSATETAFTSLNRIKIKNLASEGDLSAKKVLKLIDNFDKLLTTILVGNNLVNIAMTAICTVLFIHLCGDYGTTAATAVATVIVLVFGEISPKSIAKEKAESFTLKTANIISTIIVIFTPLNFIFSKWKALLKKIFTLEKTDVITEDEIITMVEEAENEGTFDNEQSTLIQNAIEFSELDAEDMFTARVDVKALSRKHRIPPELRS